MWCPLTLEFEIISGAADAVISPAASGTFNVNNTTTAWMIVNVRMIADVVTLDNGLQK